MVAATHAHLRLSLRDPVLWIRVGTVVLLLTVWQLVAVSGLLYDGLVPQPASVFVALIGQLGDPSMYRDLWTTVYTSVGGFVLGSVLAIVIGLWLGSNEFMRRAFEPYIVALAGTPKIIFLPIIFLVFGLGVESKIVKSAMSAFFPVIFGTISGYLQIRMILLKVGESFHLSVPQKVRMIYVPAMLPALLVGGRLGMAMAIIGVLAAEVAYSDAGLGYRLMQFSDQFQISAMYATIIIIFALASVINAIFGRIQSHKLRYLEAAGD
ncbi:ABC transporter permease [Ancylobacter sp.]|uniref:ABC transporter permease n=1 Tax=Ancylobacter sp. TaxID=1872567 RepID=UPI003BAA9896